MTYEEKFEIVVKAIKEAKKMTPSGYNTKLKITYENRLQELDLDDISFILYQLHNDHKVIKMISTANAKFLTGLDPWSEEQDYFALQILDSFEKWSEGYLNKKSAKNVLKQTRTKTAKYTRKAVEKIWNVLQEIEELRQINPSSSAIKMLYIPPGFEEKNYTLLTGYSKVPNTLNRIIEQRGTILKKLEAEYIISELRPTKAGGINAFWIFKIGTNYLTGFGKYKELYEDLAREYEEKKNQSSKGASYQFDKKEGTLTINGKKIKFTETGRKIPYLELLIKKQNYVYHSEAAEEIEGANNTLKDPKDTYYEVCRGIKVRLLAIGVTDFLKSNYNKARINPLYKKSLK